MGSQLTISRRNSMKLKSCIPAVVALALAACGTSTIPAPPAPPSVVNGNFETGDFTGWLTERQGEGAWYIYAHGTTSPNPPASDPDVPFHVPEPPEGQYAAVTDMRAPGRRILYQDLKLDGRYMLQLAIFYANGADHFASPGHFDFTSAEGNQQFRIDVMHPTAPLDSVAATDVLAMVFHTSLGDPPSLAPQQRTFDLSPWAGQTVRLRFVVVDNQGPLRAGIDAIRLDPIIEDTSGVIAFGNQWAHG